VVSGRQKKSAFIFGGQMPAAENSLFSAANKLAAENKGLFSAARLRRRKQWPSKTVAAYFRRPQLADEN
jgi:hypothetical protein